MSSSEFVKWIAYWELEPWGAIRDNLHTGMIAAMLYNINRKKGSRPKGANDFLYTDRESESDDKQASFFEYLKNKAEEDK